MPYLSLDKELPLKRITARNYAVDHPNKIHSDDTALRFGFAGALVPGVALYAYLVEPVLEMIGPDWLTRGVMSVKFIKPVYDGAEVCVRGHVARVSPPTLSLELLDHESALCAVADASLPPSPEVISVTDYPFRDMPAPESRRVATSAGVPAGEILGSLDVTLDLGALGETFLDEMGSALPIFRGPKAVCHPAYLLTQANELLARNVKLGPWIHTASVIENCALPQDGEQLSLRGRVVESGQKRGHEFVTVDLAMFGRENRTIAAIRHSALIQLRERISSGEA
jgi:hypothetical protein